MSDSTTAFERVRATGALVRLKDIPVGDFFTIKSLTYGDIAFAKGPATDHICPFCQRLWDSAGRRFDPDTVVRAITKEEAGRVQDANLAALAPKSCPVATA